MTSIMAKEWRRLLRNPALPWALAAYVLLPVLVTAAHLASMTGGPGIPPTMLSQVGGQSLALIGTWQIMLLAAGAPFVAAGLIAGEVEDGTFQPLLVAGPSLFLLVLGKLLAALGFMAVVLIAGLPLFAIPMLVGGISWPLIGRTVLLEGVTVVVMTGLGLLLSAFGRRAGTTAMVGVALGILLTLGGGLVSSAAGGQLSSQDEIVIRIRMGMDPYVGTTAQTDQVPAWLYPNPLVGLNSALSQSVGEGIFGLPGAALGDVYKEYQLWQVQAAGSLPLLLMTVLLTVLVIRMRTRWRWAVIRRRRKEEISVG